MKYVFASLFFTGLTLLAPGAGAAEGVATIECSQVENARERLACFDAMYPRDPQQPITAPKPRTIRPGPAPIAPDAPISSSNIPEEVLPTQTNQSTPTPPVKSAEDAPIRGQSKKSKEGLFDKGTKIDFTSTIAAIRAERQKKMVFRLANGQIWLQSAPRELPFSEGDVVSVKSGKLGGYIMRNEHGTSTRVSRIQ